MRFNLTLVTQQNAAIIPVNYPYPVSAAIYKIIARADGAYATFLHEQGYRQEGSLKSFKLFTFSDIRTPFKITGDRLRLTTQHAELEVCFHLPRAAENFIKGLFMQQQLDIADKKSKARFDIQSVESLPDPLQAHKPQEIINILLRPLSPVVAGLPNEKGNYDFLSPEDIRFTESLVYNWRSKIIACYDESTASSALLMMEVIPAKLPFKSRLITIKAGAPEETKIRGWMNFGVKVMGEKRFAELLLNAGTGIYNSQGMGCLEVVID
ncbi:MAG: CRISPR-associated endoribonuclease Cas6 [Chitinophagaceae bacterium]|nr:CRISPR-associated endoribonuclease Cas6 [Chitinophagaceae bacterium]